MQATRAKRPTAGCSVFSLAQFVKIELSENPTCFSLHVKNTLHVEHMHKAIYHWEGAAEVGGCESV